MRPHPAFLLALLPLLQAIGDSPSTVPATRQEAALPAAAHEFHFRSEDGLAAAVGAGAEVRNTPLVHGGLAINGRYEYNDNDKGASHAVLRTPNFRYARFTIAWRFKPDSFGLGKSNLIAGGTSHRWLTFQASKEGGLSVHLNNGDYRHDLTTPALVVNEWVVLAAAFDLPRHHLAVYRNGTLVEDIGLPDDLTLQVIGSTAEAKDHCLSFTNYSNGQTFHGIVSDVMLFDAPLSADQIGGISFPPTDPAPPTRFGGD